MKKLVCIIGILAMVCCLNACEKKVEEEEQLKIEIEDVAESKESKEPVVEKETLSLAFGKALWDVYQQGILPDGSALEYLGIEGTADNQFAITDIDGDGRDELILEWTNASMAGMCVVIYEYQDDEWRKEFGAFPAIRVYDNGIIEADASHNHTLAGRFWPFSVYRYDVESDTYLYTEFVDAWDKEIYAVNGAGENFPQEHDLDKDGLLYYIFSGDWNGKYDNAIMFDGAEYESWRKAYLKGANEIEVPYQKLTEENIAAFGCPKPER